MQIEKKLILCSVLAVAIGVASILPLQYMMSDDVVATAQTITPWFDFSMPYLYVKLYDGAGNNTLTWDGASIQGVANFTLTPDALELKNADAQIEYYRLRIYSDKGDIINLTYSAGVSRQETNVTGYPGGYYSAITGGGNNQYFFADGTTYNGSAVAGDSQCSGGSIVGILTGTLPEVNYTTSVISAYIASYGGDRSVQALDALRNANELYIDVSRICSVSYHGDSSATTSTVTTITDTNVLQHIEMTKTDGGFVYGIYKEGTVPFPMQTPSNPTGNQTLPDSVKIFTPDNSFHP